MGSFKDREDKLVAVQACTSAEAKGARISGTYAVAILTTLVGIILVRDRRNHRWELPGGFIESGESPVACALREIYEEVGIRIGTLSMIGTVIVAPPQTGDRESQELGFVYRGAWREKIHAYSSGEISGVGVFPLSALPSDMASVDRMLIDSFRGALEE